MQVTFKLYEVKPSVFVAEIMSNQILGMTFLRVQEFYESANENFRGKAFNIEDYARWYKTQSETGRFTYGEDWRGFNVPSNVIKECYALNSERTFYDNFFLFLVSKCEEVAKQNGSENFYLLGIREGATDVLNHEIAHGLFTTNNSFKKSMIEEVERLAPAIKDKICGDLSDMGYGPNVYQDEIQAYFSTGLKDSMLVEFSDEEKEEMAKPFQSVFQKYMENWVLPQPFFQQVIY